MSTVQAAGALILRIIALYTIITSLPYLGISAAQFAGAFEGEYARADAIPLLLYHSGILMAGLLLLTFAGFASRLITPGPGRDAASRPVDGDELVSIGSFLLGILLMAMYLPGVLTDVFQAMLVRMRDLDASVNIGLWFDVMRTGEKLLILLIALWLVLRPAHLAGLYRWLRTAGQGPVAPPEEMPKPE